MNSQRRPLFQVRHLSKHYRQGGSTVHALSDVDLSIESGDFIVVSGPSGSGKSTLLHLLGGLDRPDGGQVLFEGVDLASCAEPQLATIRRKELGFIFQSFNLVPVLSSYENVEYGLWLSGVRKTERRSRVENALEAVGLSDRAQHRPDQLSGGERQRVAIARALVHEPAAIVADEPTASLDPSTGAQVMEVLLGLNVTRAMTFILATHDAAIIGRAPRVVRLSGGRIRNDLDERNHE